MLSSKDVVHPTNRRSVGGRLHHFRVVHCLFRDFAHHLNEAVDRLLRLVLGRLYHQTLMEQQGEIDGGGMIAVVEQTLGHVHRGDSRRLILQTVEDELMLTEPLDRQLIDILQRLPLI